MVVRDEDTHDLSVAQGRDGLFALPERVTHSPFETLVRGIATPRSSHTV